MSGDRVYWHDGERTARVPIDCVRAIVSTAREAERVQPATCVAVFTALALHANGDGEGARPKVGTIADLLDLSEAQVRRVITKVLIVAGVVSKKPIVIEGRKVGNVYTLSRPEARIPTGTGVAIQPELGDHPDRAPERGCREQPVEQPEEQTKDPDPVTERAREIVTKVWERSDPKPLTKFIACVKLAEQFLHAGHDPQAIGEAMLAAPTITKGTIEFAINQRSRAAPSTRPVIDDDRDGYEGRLVWNDKGQLVPADDQEGTG